MLDKDRAETLGSDSILIVGFGISIRGSYSVLVTSTTSTGSSSLISSGEGVVIVSSATLGVSVFFTTSTIE